VAPVSASKVGPLHVTLVWTPLRLFVPEDEGTKKVTLVGDGDD
jgi:hypothetical protein